MKEVLPMLTAEQLAFISEECGIDAKTLFAMSEEDIEDVYERMCDVEVESVPDEGEEESERCVLASDIVTILGNTIPKHWKDEDEWIIMGPEDGREMNVAVLKSKIHEIQSERDHAEAYCIASNKYWGLVVNYSDTDEWELVEAIASEWGELYEALTEDILEILRTEGVQIPDAGQVSVIIPFMARNGYRYCAGWWDELTEDSSASSWRSSRYCRLERK